MTTEEILLTFTNDKLKAIKTLIMYGALFQALVKTRDIKVVMLNINSQQINKTQNNKFLCGVYNLQVS